MNEPALLSARGLRKQYGSGEGLVRAVDDVDIDVARGEMLAVMGPSGCGKSTLLHLLGGLDRPTSGELTLAGRRIDQLSERALAQLRRHEVGFVFQAYHLMDELTAQENVELPALLAGRAPRDAQQRARKLLEQVGLAERADHLPISAVGWPTPTGGDRSSSCQRTACCVSPTSPPETSTVRQRSRCCGSSKCCTAGGLTLVIVTHDERIAATADRLISMRDGALVDETRLVGGTRRNLADLAGLES